MGNVRPGRYLTEAVMILDWQMVVVVVALVAGAILAGAAGPARGYRGGAVTGAALSIGAIVLALYLLTAGAGEAR
jgi:hypothetical protein